mgnify:FL=1
MTLSTAQRTIEQLLTGNRQYQIPDFQRPYVWEEQQATALVNDLLDAWRTNDGDYFLGSIVLVEQPNGDNVDIIDGQQRLTTLCILVALLRHLAGTDAGLHDEIGQLLSIPESRIKGLDERPRLCVRECDRAFFDTFIVGDNIDSLLDVDANALTPTSVRRIHDNARAMLDALIDPDALPPSETQNFVQYLMLQVSLIEVTTDSYQAAHRIFSVLNTRGVPLAATDIFKANVLAHVSPERRPRYAAMWEEAIDSLATDNPDGFFGHLLTLMLRSPVKRALIDCFSEQVLTPFFTTKSGEQFIDEVLVPNARAYTLATLAPLTGHPAATHLELLRLYDSADWKPAAMYVLGTNRSDEDVRALLRTLERIYGTAVAARVVPGTRTSIVTQFISAVEDGQPIDIACSVPDDIRHRAAATIARPLPRSSIRKVLLYHALVAEQRSFPARLPRSLGVLPGLPTKQIRGVHEKIDTQAWNKRLGGLILTTLKSGTINQAPDWDTVARACHEVPVVGISTVGALPSSRGEIHEDTLEARQQHLTRLILDYWDIRRDSEGVDLSRLTSAELAAAVDKRSAARGRQVRLADVVATGIISPGDTFIWRRRNLGNVYVVTISPEGTIVLHDGREVTSPSGAVSALTDNGSAAALDVFVRESDGKKLRDLWNTYRHRFGA